MSHVDAWQRPNDLLSQGLSPQQVPKRFFCFALHSEKGVTSAWRLQQQRLSDLLSCHLLC